MSRTAVVFSPRYYWHNPGRGHPESAGRLRAIMNELKGKRLVGSTNWMFIEPERARFKDIALVHDKGYIKHVKAVCQSGGGALDSGDTVVSSESFDVALYAAGGALKAVRIVLNKEVENAFALVRPPGHHAEKFRAFGFCIFNNVAIAAQSLLSKSGLQRILIFDIDAHHGNGTQEIFYETDKVLYISLHENPRDFPGTGFVDEIGEGSGVGCNVNIPLPFGSSDQIYLRAVTEIAIPIAHQYRPQFMLVSAGFDTHYADPVGSLSLSAKCCDKVCESLVDLASKTCDGRLVAVLEGGYNLRFVGKMAASAVARMSRTPYLVEDKAPEVSKKTTARGERVLEDVKKVQRDYWNIG